MNRLMFIGALSLLALLAVGALIQEQEKEQEKEIPETIILENSKGTVTFPHSAHHQLGYTCKTCHHYLKDVMNLPNEKCGDCHTADSDVTIQDAFHKTCRDCHREYQKEHEDTTAPTACSACHVKPE
jgi:hypothetical protein